MWSEKAALVPQLDALVEGARTPHSPLGTNKVRFRWLQDKTQLHLDNLLFDLDNRPSPILRFDRRLPRLARRLQPCHPRPWGCHRPHRWSLVRHYNTCLRMTEQSRSLNHPRHRVSSMLRARLQSLRRPGRHGRGMMLNLCPGCEDDR